MVNRNERIEKIADDIKPKQSKIETILTIVAVVAIVLRMYRIAGNGLLLTLSLSTLAALFFISSYALPQGETSVMEIFIKKLFAYGSSVATMGILFIIQSYKGSPTMIFTGCATILLAIIFSYYKQIKVNVKRPVIILAIAAGLYITPKEKLMELHIIHAPIENPASANNK